MACLIVCSYIEAMEDSMEDFQKFDTADKYCYLLQIFLWKQWNLPQSPVDLL